MRSRLAGSRGPQRFLLLALCLLLAVVGLNYYRLLSTNSALTERLRQLDELRELDSAELHKQDDARQRCQGELQKSGDELRRLRAELDERVSKMQQQSDRLADMQEEATACQKEAEELKEKHEQELTDEAAGRRARLAEAEESLETVRKQLEETNLNLTLCSSQSCGDRLKQLQFDLDTCRFSRQHAGSAGIIRPTTAGEPASRSSLDKLFESAGGAGPSYSADSPPASGQQGQPAASRAAAAAGPPANNQVSSTSESGAGQLRPPSADSAVSAAAGASAADAAGASAADAGAEGAALNPAESPASGEVLSAGGQLRPAGGGGGGGGGGAGAEGTLDLAPVDGGLGKDTGRLEEVPAGEPAQEDPAPAAEEEAEGEDGEPENPAGRVVPRLTGDEEGGAAAGEPPADLEYAEGQLKEDGANGGGDGVAEDEAAADPGQAGADESAAAAAAAEVKDAALISGLQELSEKADPGELQPGDELEKAGPAELPPGAELEKANPGDMPPGVELDKADPADLPLGPEPGKAKQQPDVGGAAAAGDKSVGSKPAEPAAGDQKIADFEDAGAV